MRTLLLSITLICLAGHAFPAAAAAKKKAPPPAPASAPAAAMSPAAEPAAAPGPSAEEVLGRVDAILGPPEFEARLTFITRKPKGESSFSMSYLAKGNDKFRLRFLTPPDDAGAEVLRVADDFWHYLPNLKRALKISAKQEFHGGDFANSDVLRVYLTREYHAAFSGEPAPAGQWLLELTARDDTITYARVKAWVRQKDFQPLVFEYYSGAGKLVRRLEFSELKSHGSLVRPSRMVMRNMLEPKRTSELVWDSFAVRQDLEDALFERSALGR